MMNEDVFRIWTEVGELNPLGFRRIFRSPKTWNPRGLFIGFRLLGDQEESAQDAQYYVNIRFGVIWEGFHS